eukprot:EG_transcript_5969
MASSSGSKVASRDLLQRAKPSFQPPPWLSAFAVAAIGGALFGYDIGASSSVLRLLGGSTTLGVLDPLQLGYIASGSLFGAVLASAVLIGLGDANLGRRTELQTAAALYLGGTVLQAAAPTLPLLLLGRVVYGLGIGTAMHVAPLYIAETSPPDLRGKLVSLKEAAIVGGIVLGFLAGPVFSEAGDWRAVFGAAVVLGLPMLLLACAVPESSRWLVLQGRPQEAVASLMQCQGLDEAAATQQVQEMVSLAATSKADRGIWTKVGQLTATPTNRKALVIGVGLVLFQQLSGQPSVLYYANRIFEGAGLGFEAAVGVGVFKFLMTLVSVQLVEDPRCGRRPLLLIGTAGMALSLVGLSLLFLTAGAAAPNPTAVIASVVAFVGCYQIGFGPITWLILSEIFPLEIRSTAVSAGALANFGSNVLVALLFDFERLRFGEAILFGQFALVALLALLFESRFVPETRGLTLEQIEAQLRGGEEAPRWSLDP